MRPGAKGQLASNKFFHCNEGAAMLGTILLVLLILFLIGSLPTWPYSAGWGYFPSGGLGIVLVVVIVLLVMGRI